MEPGGRTWKDLRRPNRARRGAFLFLALEGERPLAGGARYQLEGLDEVRLGRAERRMLAREGKLLRIGLPDPWLSGAHLSLKADGKRWTLRDLGSSNGTLVNGATCSEAALEDGDAILAGHAALLFRDAIEAEPAQAGDLDSVQIEAVDAGFATLQPELAAQLQQAARVACSPVPMLIRGETGTGKELLAAAVHRAFAAGANKPFVAVNCGALPAGLVEATLFGHRKGAFTGADEDRPGLVAGADGGTLFLDEIGDLPLPAQAALLRVLQESEVHAVGAGKPMKVRIRVLAATNRDLPALVAQGRFRADLFARLDGFSIELPPLRERREDTGLFVAAALKRIGAARATLTAEACELLLRYAWPLNVRELHNALGSASVLAEGGPIDAAHLPPALKNDAPPPLPGDAESLERRDQIERLLREHQGNVSAVARAMGKERMQIQRWLRRYRLDPAAYRK